MAEEIKVPGVGGVKREYVVAGAGLVAGLVGYAWWKARSTAEAAPVTVDPNLIPETERTPVVGDSTQHVDTRDPNAISDSASWTRHATDYLMTQGWESQAVAAALGRWIAHAALSPADVEIVNAARAAFGDPPGGPYPVTPALPSSAPPPPPNLVRVVSASGHSVTIAWDPVPGATSYYLTAAEPSGPSTRIPDRTTSDTEFTWAPLGPNISYTFTVAARNAAGKSEPRAAVGKTTA